jgi:tetratricopeptide (TPR) repeat protein
LTLNELYELAKDRPLSTNEIYSSNAFYGNSTVLKRYADISETYQVKFAIEHGPSYAYHVWDADVNAPVPGLLISSPFRYQFLKSKTNKVIFSIGPLVHYASNYLDNNSLDLEKKRLGRNLLVFAAHSTHFLDNHYDIRNYCEVIKRFKKDFDNIRVCLYWKDILRGHSEIYMEYGFECITAGHMFDPLFLSRLKTFIELASFTTSNQLGTHIGFCIFMGKPHYLYRDKVEYTSSNSDLLSKILRNEVKDDYNKVEKDFFKLFADYSEYITLSQKEIVNKYWGVNEIKTPEEIQLIFQTTEDIYQKSPGFYMSDKDILTLQSLEYLNLKENNKSLFLINQSIKINPENKSLNYGKAIALGRAGLINEAVETLEKFIIPGHKKAIILRDELMKNSMFMKQTSGNSIKTFEENNQISIKKLIEEAYKLLYENDYNLAFNILIKAKSLKLPHQGLDYLRAVCFMKMNQFYAAKEAIREELRYFPDNLEARKLLDQILIQIPETSSSKIEDREFNELLEIIRPYTMLGEERLYSLFSLTKRICLENIPGNFVECGVAAGGSSALLAYVIKRYSRQTRFHYAFDSFDGMPPPTESDKHNGIDADLTGWGTGTCAAGENSIREICTKLGVLDVIKTVKGYFEDTLPAMKNTAGMISFLHMDGDWYSSTKVILNNLYDHIVNDGVIQVDDYGYWEGCKKAIHEFESLKNLKFNINQIDGTGVWFSKPDRFPINKDISPQLVSEFNTEEPALIGIESQMSPNERFQLYYAIKKNLPVKSNPLRFIEVGSYAGASLVLIWRALKRIKNDISGFTVEPVGTPQFYEVLKQLGNEIIHFRMFSHQAVTQLKQIFEQDNNYPELIFIDGDHTYEGVKTDIINYYPLLAPGGIMIFHDYLPPLNDENRETIFSHHAGNEPGIRKACQEMMEDTYHCEIIDIPLLYPTDPTQTQSHLPIIPGVFSTIKIYKKYLLNTDTPEADNIEAEMKFKMGDKDTVKDILLNLIKRWPDDTRGLNNLGIIYRVNKDIVNAMKYFTKALRISPDNRITILNMGDILVSLKEYEKAKKLYSLYLEKNPDDFEIKQLLQDVERKNNTSQKTIVEANIPEITTDLTDKFELNSKERACHLKQLFIKHDGNIYPCCRVWDRDELRIGHIDDPEIFNLLTSFNKDCSCEAYKFRRILPDEKLQFELFNIEFSLACQGNCAMCCVHAPSWRGSYDYYDSLTKLVDLCKPYRIAVQGGEVLVQMKSLEWLSKIKQKYSDVKLHIVTNGNVDLEKVELVEKLFSTMTISIVGFETETYKKIMGMDLEKTIRFAETLIHRSTVEVSLKYLVTPLNFHQAGLFIKWGVNIKAPSLQLVDANILSYINLNTFDNFWLKIFERTSQDIKAIVINNKQIIRENKTLLFIDSSLRKLLHIDNNFIKKNDLYDILEPWY